MAKSTVSDNQKSKRPPGRPPTGITPLVGVRLEPDFRAEIETWAMKQEDKPSLAEAIRRLLRLGLSVAKLARRKPKTK